MCEVMCSGVFGGDGGVVGWMLIGMGMKRSDGFEYR